MYGVLVHLLSSSTISCQPPTFFWSFDIFFYRRIVLPGRKACSNCSYWPVERFVDGCVMPILVYCSPVISPGLLQKDFANILCAIYLLSRASDLNIEWFHSRTVERYINACDSVVKQILAQENHNSTRHYHKRRPSGQEDPQSLHSAENIIISAYHHPLRGLIPLPLKCSSRRAHPNPWDDCFMLELLLTLTWCQFFSENVVINKNKSLLFFLVLPWVTRLHLAMTVVGNLGNSNRQATFSAFECSGTRRCQCGI